MNASKGSQGDTANRVLLVVPALTNLWLAIWCVLHASQASIPFPLELLLIHHVSHAYQALTLRLVAQRVSNAQSTLILHLVVWLSSPALAMLGIRALMEATVQCVQRAHSRVRKATRHA